MKRSTALFIALLVITVILGSCTDKGLNPIFYTLENERSLDEDERGMPKNSNVHKIVRSEDNSRYFAAVSMLYSRLDAVGERWTVLSPPAAIAGANCDTLGVFKPGVTEYVYAGFYSDSGQGLGLWRWDQGGSSWAQVTDTNTNLQNDDQIYMIETVNANLFVAVGIYNGVDGYDSFDLYYSSDGAAFDHSTFDIGSGSVETLPVPITDIAWDGANTYWITAGPYLLEDTDGLASLDFALVAGGPTNPGVGAETFGGVLYDSDASKFYVSTTGGELWSFNGGWAVSDVVSVDSEAVQFTDFVDLTPFTPDNLVGSRGTGYFRLIGGDVTDTERFQEYNITSVYNGAIHNFLFDPLGDEFPNVLFACTISSGLWRASYSGTEWIWVQE